MCDRRLFVLIGLGAAILLTAVHAGAGIPDGLLFHASFNNQVTDADTAKGDKSCTLDANLDFRPAEGIIGAGLLQEPGERCSYSVPGNLDTNSGSFSVWVKPLSWSGDSRKFRHALTVTGVDDYVMLLYLYPIGDEAVFNYIRVNGKKPNEATWRAGTPVDILERGEWTHLVSTWGQGAVRLYANGKRVGEGLVAAPLPKADTGTFTVCPIEFWRHAQWSDPEEKTICDEIRVFDHPLSDDEALALYAAELPGGLPDLKPRLTIAVVPDFFAKRIAVTVTAAHLDQRWQERVSEGIRPEIVVSDPTGRVLNTTGAEADGAAPVTEIAVEVGEWQDGDYTVRATLRSGRDMLQAVETLTKPPTPWLPREMDWRATREVEPWEALRCDGTTVHYWNGDIELPGALPGRITSRGQAVLAAPVRLKTEKPATWGRPTVLENEPHRVTYGGRGRLGGCSLTYRTLVEYDGLVRTDVTLLPPLGGANIATLTLEIPVPKQVATWYRNPTCTEWSGEPLEEDRFLPYGWLGNEERGLSWFMESEANWRVGEGKPYISLTSEGDSIVVRLHLISKPTRIDQNLHYTFGFEPTPVRPLGTDLYTTRWAGGPYMKGVNTFVYGWRTQICDLNGRLLASDPAHQRAFVDRWRAKGMETRSYTCLQCTSNASPEYVFFKDEWNQPYGATFSGYKRGDDGTPYSMVGVCPQSSFSDFLVWCVREHIRNDWSGGIYTDIDGAKPCDNRRHGCGFTDAFGRTGRTWPLYAHRGVSRRLYEACHDAGKRYYSHAHSNWYSLFNAFNDGWAPGEQYSSKAMKNPYFYMEELPDRVWRSEFCSSTTGVPTFLLPQIGRLGDKGKREERGPSESCIAAAMAYGVPLWASLNKQVVEEVWAAQRAFGMANSTFEPFWRQKSVNCSSDQLRVSLWRKPNAWLVVVANFTGEEQTGTLTAAGTFTPVWLADGLAAAKGTTTITVPARRGALLRVAPND
ncbi:MAG: LamG domain-containing protein [Lentisphaerae bacterium]|nr:LamG domain-containing protein [Lentisphaerota bacterium]MBT5611105.1 LamG domain-containing protein [Lentisphaerota bacterium]MBT7061271.1 LamG domain-containing protein [Lentisphaerota bacterium]MBT7846594.1 LamG domain-containing protein [Lentisphaerota bacterium]